MTEIILHACDLKNADLPGRVPKMKGAKTLDLSRNFLSTLPDEIETLQTSLVNLNLNSNRFDRLPASLLTLTNLESLSLASNDVDTLEGIEKLTKLVTLEVQINGLGQLPQHLSKLKNLKKINLSSNEIKSIENIANLPNLEILNLSSNRIQEVPDNIGTLESLNELILTGNQIKKISPQITKLKKLTQIYFTSNQLTEIPENFGELSSLVTLDFRKNQIKRLPPKIFANMPNVKIIDLSYNKLRELPTVDHLSTLKELNVSNNKLTQFPESILDLAINHTLKKLDISCNYLAKLPKCRQEHIDKLKCWFFYKNFFVEIPEEILEELNYATKETFFDALPDKILDNVFLGSSFAATNKQGLKALGITHILNAAIAVQQFPKHFKYRVLNLLDSYQQEIQSQFEHTIKFIEEAVASGGKVLVHCQVGMSRSATLVIAYLMHAKKMKYMEAFAYTVERRAVVNPNPGFKKQLAAFEEMLRTRGHYDTPIIEEVVDSPNKENSPSNNDNTSVNGSADLTNGETSQTNGSDNHHNNSDDKQNNSDVNNNSENSSVNSSMRKSVEVLNNTHSNSHAVVDEKSE
jgi:Leucine-rich repeat (LRR) protein/protein-tyrosine phosphatase